MVFDDLKKALSEVIMDLKPAPIPDEPVEFEMVTLYRSETDNSRWLSYITAALKDAKTTVGTRKRNGSSLRSVTAG